MRRTKTNKPRQSRKEMVDSPWFTILFIFWGFLCGWCGWTFGCDHTSRDFKRQAADRGYATFVERPMWHGNMDTFDWK